MRSAIGGRILHAMQHQKEDNTGVRPGDRFGELTAEERGEDYIYPAVRESDRAELPGWREVRWWFRCSCDRRVLWKPRNARWNIEKRGVCMCGECLRVFRAGPLTSGHSKPPKKVSEKRAQTLVASPATPKDRRAGRSAASAVRDKSGLKNGDVFGWLIAMSRAPDRIDKGSKVGVLQWRFFCSGCDRDVLLVPDHVKVCALTACLECSKAVVPSP